MATIWRGTKRGDEYETVEFVEFDGEEFGRIREATDVVEKTTVVYRADDGRIAIHEIRTRDNKTHARVYFFTSVAAAWPNFGWELEMVGLRPRRAILHMPEEYD